MPAPGDQGHWSTGPSTFAPTPVAAGQGRSPKTRLVLVAVAGLVVLTVLGFVVARFVRTPVFDQTAMERDVAEVIKKDFGEGRVSEVSCPSGQKVRLNSTFTCTAKIDGRTKRVTIKVLNEDNAEYEVGQPR